MSETQPGTPEGGTGTDGGGAAGGAAGHPPGGGSGARRRGRPVDPGSKRQQKLQSVKRRGLEELAGERIDVEKRPELEKRQEPEKKDEKKDTGPPAHKDPAQVAALAPMCGMALGGIVNLIRAKRKMPPLHDELALALGGAGATVALKYLPDDLLEYKEELVLAGVLFAAVTSPDGRMPEVQLPAQGEAQAGSTAPGGGGAGEGAAAQPGGAQTLRAAA